MKCNLHLFWVGSFNLEFPVAKVYLFPTTETAKTYLGFNSALVATIRLIMDKIERIYEGLNIRE